MNSDSNCCDANIRPYRMVIELDRERVRESGYDLDEVQALIDQICAACGSIKMPGKAGIMTVPRWVVS